ncbi:hypothetical protein DDP54_08025 [Cellulomonas sp. WB94]|nr:hypothetical protein DDP54_08025 [Cellulomonas sp. WB94]
MRGEVHRRYPRSVCRWRVDEPSSVDRTPGAAIHGHAVDRAVRRIATHHVLVADNGRRPTTGRGDVGRRRRWPPLIDGPTDRLVDGRLLDVDARSLGVCRLVKRDARSWDQLPAGRRLGGPTSARRAVRLRSRVRSAFRLIGRRRRATIGCT